MISQDRANTILRELGYDGPTPLLDFQKKEGLPATGKLDEATSQRLEGRYQEHLNRWPWYVWAGILVGVPLIAWGAWKLLSSPSTPALAPRRPLAPPLPQKLKMLSTSSMGEQEEAPATLEEPPDTPAPVAERIVERYTSPEPFKAQMEPAIVLEDERGRMPLTSVVESEIPMTPRPRKASVAEMIEVERYAQRAALRKWADKANLDPSESPELLDAMERDAAEKENVSAISNYMKRQSPKDIATFRKLVTEERREILRKRFGR